MEHPGNHNNAIFKQLQLTYLPHGCVVPGGAAWPAELTEAFDVAASARPRLPTTDASDANASARLLSRRRLQTNTPGPEPKQWPARECFVVVDAPKLLTKGFALAWAGPTLAASACGYPLLPYTGELVHLNEASAEDIPYCAELRRPWQVSAAHMGNEARFANHSCAPNCALKHYYTAVEGQLALALCLRPGVSLEAGDQLTLWYGWMPTTSTEKAVACHCGAASCAGFLYASDREPAGTPTWTKASDIGKLFKEKLPSLTAADAALSLLARRHAQAQAALVAYAACMARLKATAALLASSTTASVSSTAATALSANKRSRADAAPPVPATTTTTAATTTTDAAATQAPAAAVSGTEAILEYLGAMEAHLGATIEKSVMSKIMPLLPAAPAGESKSVGAAKGGRKRKRPVGRSGAETEEEALEGEAPHPRGAAQLDANRDIEGLKRLHESTALLAELLAGRFDKRHGDGGSFLKLVQERVRPGAAAMATQSESLARAFDSTLGVVYDVIATAAVEVCALLPELENLVVAHAMPYTLSAHAKLRSLVTKARIRLADPRTVTNRPFWAYTLPDSTYSETALGPRKQAPGKKKASGWQAEMSKLLRAKPGQEHATNALTQPVERLLCEAWATPDLARQLHGALVAQSFGAQSFGAQRQLAALELAPHASAIAKLAAGYRAVVATTHAMVMANAKPPVILFPEDVQEHTIAAVPTPDQLTMLLHLHGQKPEPQPQQPTTAEEPYRVCLMVVAAAGLLLTGWPAAAFTGRLSPNEFHSLLGQSFHLYNAWRPLAHTYQLQASVSHLYLERVWPPALLPTALHPGTILVPPPAPHGRPNVGELLAAAAMPAAAPAEETTTTMTTTTTTTPTAPAPAAEACEQPTTEAFTLPQHPTTEATDNNYTLLGFDFLSAPNPAFHRLQAVGVAEDNKEENEPEEEKADEEEEEEEKAEKEEKAKYKEKEKEDKEDEEDVDKLEVDEEEDKKEEEEEEEKKATTKKAPSPSRVAKRTGRGTLAAANMATSASNEADQKKKRKRAADAKPTTWQQQTNKRRK